MVPYDVLVDPESIPKHPTFESDEELVDVIEDDEDLDGEHEMETVGAGKDVSPINSILLRKSLNSASFIEILNKSHLEVCFH